MKIVTALVSAICVICCFLYFRYIVPYHVCFKEQIQMFVFTSSYLLSYFSKPAALACLVGDFLTQFLYFKTGGAAVITMLLVIQWRLIFMTLKRFSVKTRFVVSLFPVVIEWILYSSVFFSLDLSISLIITLLAFLVYSKTSGKISVTTGLVLIPVLYVIGGASVLLFLILVILYEIHCERKRFAYTAVILQLAITVPIIFRHFYLLTLEQAYLFPYPGIKQGLSLVTLALIVLLYTCFKNLKLESLRFCRIQTPKMKPVIMSIILISILIVGLVKNTDKKLENLYGIIIEAYHRNWDKVLTIAESAELENPIAACFTNIALSENNLLGKRLMDFYQPFSSGLLLPSVPTPVSSSLTLFSSNDAYYHIGDLEMAQHAAIIGMLSTPRQRSARLVERLAEINMATGDIPAAQKYIRMLESTLFYRKKVDNFKYKTHIDIFHKNIIRSANDFQISLELLAESNPDNLPALNYLLCFYLLNKDIPDFFEAYSSYFKEKGNNVPKVYAEALLIYFAATKATAKELSDYGIPPEIIRSFGNYTRLYQESGGNLVSMQKKFSNTYWLYYHFAVFE